MAIPKSAITFIAPMAAILILISSAGATALSSLEENASDFPKGQLSNIKAGPEGLSMRDTQQADESWTRMSSGTPYGNPEYNLLSAYDPVSKLLVLSRRNDGDKPEIWTYNFTSGEWDQRDCPLNEDSRAAAMVYDSANGVMVLFGQHMDTMTYNVSNGCWTGIDYSILPYNWPKPSMVYDGAGRQMILFGAADNYSSPHNQTWAYNMSTKTWTNLNPASAPSGYYHALAYDSQNGVIVASGPFGSSPDAQETWTYDPRTNIWTNQTPLHSPPMREYPAMAYDVPTSQVVLFGGCNGDEYLNDTWVYNITNNDWTQKFPSPAPSPRGYHTMAYDTDRNLAYVWGGVGPDSIRDPMWAYDAESNRWTDLNPADIPSCRCYHAMAYDSSTDTTVLFGGCDDDPRGMCDTYAYNLSTNSWKNLRPASAPPARYGHAMAYDRSSGKVILFGGFRGTNFYCSDTWAYDSKNNTWTDLKPASSPSGSEKSLMAYDSAHEVMVLFGGKGGNETWTYDSGANTWTNMSPAVSAPVSLCGYLMTYDSASGEMFLYGESTWTYNLTANTWVQKNPENTPYSYRGGGALTYDSAKGLTVLFGLGSTWAYNASGNTWTKMDIPDQPSDRSGCAMAYDERERKTVLFGGSNGFYDQDTKSDTWVLDLCGDHGNGTYISVPFDAGGAACFGACEWTADTPANTDIVFQLRTADTAGDLCAKSFLGPDGTETTSYTLSGQRMNAVHNGSRWLQYRATLQSHEPSVSPILKDVTVRYNLLQSLSIISPAAGDNWTGVRNIAWSASDPDNDDLHFDIYLENSTSSTILTSDKTDETRRWTWNASSVPAGTYRIRVVARDDNPSIPVSVSALSGNFTVPAPPPPNHLPRVDLLSPPNNSFVNRTGVVLEWNGTDEDGDTLKYVVLYADHPIEDGNCTLVNTDDRFLEIGGLSDNTTYYWTVIPFDGKTQMPAEPVPVWRFTVRLPSVNHPPRITSFPPTTVLAGETYTYNLTAIDEDLDILRYSLVQAPKNMSIDNITGKLRWPTAASDIGNHSVTVRVSDTVGASDNQTFTIQVLEVPVPPAPPTCKITSPANNSRVSGRVLIRGTALNGTLPITFIQVRIDNGSWQTAVGLDSWTFTINTAKLAKGNHRIQARALDANLYSDTASVDVVVNNPEPGISIGGIPWCLPAIVVAVAAGLGVLLLLRKKTGEPGSR